MTSHICGGDTILTFVQLRDCSVLIIKEVLIEDNSRYFLIRMLPSQVLIWVHIFYKFYTW